MVSLFIFSMLKIRSTMAKFRSVICRKSDGLFNDGLKGWNGLALIQNTFKETCGYSEMLYLGSNVRQSPVRKSYPFKDVPLLRGYTSSCILDSVVTSSRLLTKFIENSTLTFQKFFESQSIAQGLFMSMGLRMRVQEFLTIKFENWLLEWVRNRLTK